MSLGYADTNEEYVWERQRQNIPYRIHGVDGLGNLMHWKFTTSYLASSMHYHQHLMEIHFIVKGRRQFQILNPDDTLQHFSLTGNEGILFFPGQRHTNGPSPQMPGESYVFQLDLSEPDHLLGMDPSFSRALYNKLMQLDYQSFPLNRSMLFALKNAFDFITSNDPVDIYRGVQYLDALLFSLPKRGHAQQRPAGNDPKIEKALQYFEAHFYEPIQIKELAAAAGYSPSYFKGRFRDEYGITPALYIMRKRMDYARHQLEETDITIVALAEQMGFSSAEYFSGVFKKHFQVSPSEYRRMAQIVPMDWEEE